MRFRHSIVPALALVLCACSIITGPDRLKHVSDDTATQRKAWNAQGLKNYTYHVQKSCFCDPNSLRLITVVVVNGAIASASYDDTGAAVPPSSFSSLYSVDALYNVIEDALDRKAATLTVTYDGVLHYPTSIQIDYILNAADDELWFAASGLRAGS